MPLLQSRFFLFSPLLSKLPDFPNQKGFITHEGIIPTNWQRKREIPNSPLPSLLWSWSYDDMLHLLAGAMRRLLSKSIFPGSATFPKAEHRTSMAGSWWVSAQCHASPEPGSACMISGWWPDHLFFLLSSLWALVVLFGQLFILGLAL